MTENIYNVTAGKTEYSCRIESGMVYVNGEEFPLPTINREGFATIRAGEQYKKIFVRQLSESSFEVWINNYRIPVTIEPELPEYLKQYSHSADLKKEITINAPMPGLVVKIEVKEGEEVLPGNGLIILEAMKMENEIRNTVPAIVKKILVEKRSKVEKGQALMILEPVGKKP